MSQKKSPSPPSLPPDAQREILNRLSAETRISSREIAAILERHGVCGDIDALQDAYRKRLGQRLMATIGMKAASVRCWPPAAASMSSWIAVTIRRS